MMRSEQLIVRRIQRALLILIFLGTLVRVIPIGYDAPWGGLFSSDEIDSVSRALKLATGDLLPIHANKPTHYAEILALAYGMQYATECLLLGTSREHFERRFFLAPFLFYASARVVTAGFGVATLSLLLWSLRRHGLGAQLLAMATVALASSSVLYSHIAKEDVVAQFWTFATFAAALEMLAANRSAHVLAFRRWAWISAGAAGLAVSTKYNCFWVPLFCIAAWILSWRDAPPGNRPLLRKVALGAFLALGAGFVIGTPAAVLQPGRFLKATLASDIVSEVGHGLASLHYADKYGWRFFVRIWDAEFGLGWVSALLAVGLFVERGRSLRYFVLAPVAVYIVTLLVAGHLDYQYAILVTPIAGWLIAHEMTARAHQPRKRLVRLAILAFLALALLQNTYRVARRTAECLGGDTRIAAGQWLENEAKAHPDRFAKPLLIVAPFYYRYHPAIALTAATYERLQARAQASGRQGGYFERAAHYAELDSRPQFDAEFLDVKWHFVRQRDGSRLFLEQPFSLNLRDYAGKYSAVIVPEATFLYLEQDPPEAANMVAFLREIRRLPLWAEFHPKPWRRAGPSLWIYAPPQADAIPSSSHEALTSGAATMISDPLSSRSGEQK